MSGITAYTLRISAEQLEVMALDSFNDGDECPACGHVEGVIIPPAYQSVLKRIAKDLRKAARKGVEI